MRRDVAVAAAVVLWVIGSSGNAAAWSERPGAVVFHFPQLGTSRWYPPEGNPRRLGLSVRQWLETKRARYLALHREMQSITAAPSTVYAPASPGPEYLLDVFPQARRFITSDVIPAGPIDRLVALLGDHDLRHDYIVRMGQAEGDKDYPREHVRHQELQRAGGVIALWQVGDHLSGSVRGVIDVSVELLGADGRPLSTEDACQRHIAAGHALRLSYEHDGPRSITYLHQDYRGSWGAAFRAAITSPIDVLFDRATDRLLLEHQAQTARLARRLAPTGIMLTDNGFAWRWMERLGIGPFASHRLLETRFGYAADRHAITGAGEPARVMVAAGDGGTTREQVEATIASLDLSDHDVVAGLSRQMVLGPLYRMACDLGLKDDVDALVDRVLSQQSGPE